MDLPDDRRRGRTPGRGPETPPFRHVVVDEIQDLHPAQWRLLRAATPRGPDDLFLTGDPHQRIYGNHVSLRQVGISVRGRSCRLRINYRTSAEILQWSMGILGDIAIADLDEGVDSLTGYRSALHGAPPELAAATNAAQEAEDLAMAIEEWREEAWTRATSSSSPARSVSLRSLAKELGVHGIRSAELRETEPPSDAIRLSTMHGMKGLEFRCVAIVGVGKRNFPLSHAVTPMAEDPVPARPRRAAGALSAVRGVHAGTRAAPGLVVGRRESAGTARTHAGVGAYPKSTNLLPAKRARPR